MEKFRVGLTRDFLTSNSELVVGDMGLEKLTSNGNVSGEFFPEQLAEVSAAQAGSYDATISMSPRYRGRSMSSANLSLGLVARLGVGYDMVDVEALTEQGVMLTITPDGVRRPIVTAIVVMLLALAHTLVAKDPLVQEGKWRERISIKATALTGSAFGSIGFGNIGREVIVC